MSSIIYLFNSQLSKRFEVACVTLVNLSTSLSQPQLSMCRDEEL